MRYLPHTEEDVAAMLATIKATSLDDLFKTVPAGCRLQRELVLPSPMSEWELNDHMDGLAARMASAPSYKIFLGAGRYNHALPSTCSYLLSRGEFTTAYTPYQPEISQGSLQGIFEFQTLCARLLGLDVATASHYDGATALAEALLIALRKTKRKQVAISKLIHPFYRQVVDAYLKPTEYRVVEIPFNKDGVSDPNTLDDLENSAAVAVQSPNFFGCIEDLTFFAERAHEHGALLISSFTEPLAYGLLKNPGSQGVDIAAGEGQSLGIPSSFGGPGLGILASTKPFMRNLPGRLVGQTIDQNGERGFVLTLTAREQHIRREKATSNICSNNGLCALAAAMYMASLGGTGFRKLAALNHDKAEYLKKQLIKAGVRIPFAGAIFNEFVADFGPDFPSKYKNLLRRKIVAGLPLERFFPRLKGHSLLCVTETMNKDDMDALVRGVKK